MAHSRLTEIVISTLAWNVFADSALSQTVAAPEKPESAPPLQMIFTLISKSAPMYGQGPKLGEDWYERAPGVPMFSYDEASVARELGAYGIADVSAIDEPVAGGSYPFYNVTCVKG